MRTCPMSSAVGVRTTTRDSSVATASSVTPLPVRMGGVALRGHPALYVTAHQDLQVMYSDQQRVHQN